MSSYKEKRALCLGSIYDEKNKSKFFFNYKLPKFLCDVISPHIFTEYYAKDHFIFVKEIQKVCATNIFMVSYDLGSLLTNLPLNEAKIEITFVNYSRLIRALQLINKNNLLFNYATAQTHFLFNEEFFYLTGGVALSYPLDSAVANLFIVFYEKKWLESLESSKVRFYFRYEDVCLIMNMKLRISFSN